MNRVLWVVISTGLLFGCTMGLKHRDPVEAKHILAQAVEGSSQHQLEQLPPAVEDDLMPDLVSDSHSMETVKRYNIKADEVNAKAFFTSLVKGTPYSIAIHPNVSGQITVNLSDVSLDEVFAVVRDIYGFDIEKSDHVIQVFPAGLRTVTIPVNYIQFKRSGRSLTSITTSTVSSSSSSTSSSSSDSSSSTPSTSSNGGTAIETTSESDFWPQLQSSIEKLVGSGKGQQVVVTPQASLVTLRAFPDEIRQVRHFLGVSEKRLHRQVILEAKIVEVTLSDGYQQGINWSNLSFDNGKVVMQRLGASTLPDLDDIGTLLHGQTNVTISDGSFSGVLSFMQTQGDVNVLSSPRVTAANNQKAVIKVGTDEYYVTDVSSVVVNGTADTETTVDIDLTPFFSGISLDVTPQIDDQGNVILHVHPAVIDVKDQTKQITYGDSTITLPLAESSVRESDSVIRAQDGDVVVIGGLMKTNIANKVSKVPLLGDLPVLGHLFRNVSEYTEKTELVILLKPTVVGVNTWQKELERSQGLLNDWFPDSK